MGQINVLGSFLAGRQARRDQDIADQTNAMQSYLRTQGPALMRGDPNAIEGLVGYDPMLAMGLKDRFEAKRAASASAASAAESAELKSVAEAARAAYERGPDAFEGLVDPYREQLQAQGVDVTYDTFPMLYAKVTGNQIEPLRIDSESESKLRKEWMSIPANKDFDLQVSAKSRIDASAEDPSAAGDLALIFNYMKLLDPGSTVREGEFATAQNAAGVEGRIASLYNNILSGERLNEAQRADFVDRSDRLFNSAYEKHKALRSQFEGIAKAYGLDTDRAIPLLWDDKSSAAGTPPPEMENPYLNLTEEEFKQLNLSTMTKEQREMLYEAISQLSWYQDQAD